MSKSLASILTAVAVVGVQFIPGVGQAVGALIASAGLGTVTAGTAVAIASLAVAATGAILQSLLPGQSVKPGLTETSIKSPTPPRVSGYGEGRQHMAFALYVTDSSGAAIDVGAMHDGKIDSIIGYYLGDTKVTVLSDGRVQAGEAGQFGERSDIVQIYTRLGNSTETAFPQVVSRVPSQWTFNHRGDGVVTAAVITAPTKSKYYQMIFPTGGPNNMPLSLAMRRQLVFDWRDPAQSASNPATWRYSENAVLHLAHYLLVRDNKDWATHFVPTLGYWTAAANDADSAVALKSGGVEARYRSCFAHQHTDPYKDCIAGLLACFDGWMAPRADGALVVYSGRYVVPTITLGPDQINSYSMQDGIEEESALNQLSVTYVSAEHDYNVVDTDAWENTADISERGKILSNQLANQVPSHSQARRLAKRKMAQISAPKRGSVTTNAYGRIALGQRYIRLQLIDAGVTFLDAPVEIVAPVKRNLQTGGITFNWILADPSVDAWNPATEEGLPAPVGTRAPALPLDPPTITSALADFSAVADSGTGVRIVITASGLNRSDVSWYARWRLVGSPTWNEQQYPDVDAGSSVTLETGFVPTGSNVEVEVAYSTGDDRLSPYSDPPVVVSTATDATPPDPASAITLVSWSDALNLVTGRIARATNYRWRFFNPADLETPVRTIVTSAPSVSYTSAQAAADGVRRDYVVTVSGVNGAGNGTAASTGTITLPAPAAVTGFAAADGASESQVTFTLSMSPGVTGYTVAISTVSGFNPLTQGTLFTVYGSPAYLQNLTAGNFFAKVAAFDAWTSRPDLLNFSGEDGFSISTGGGGVGGGGGGGGGGYCVSIDTLVLMADGTQRPAGNLVVGDMLRTQHEATLEWGDYPVEAIELVNDDVFAVDIGSGLLRATAGHLIFIGGHWIRMDSIGYPDGQATVAKITVADAHTYVSGGVLSHNIKQNQLEP